MDRTGKNKFMRRAIALAQKWPMNSGEGGPYGCCGGEGREKM